MKSLKTYVLLVMATLFMASCNPSNKKNQTEYQIKSVKGHTNNTIEVLDFGGSGQPLFFLTGLGNAAYVYVDFAPKFKDNFHVYAMSRRGYGGSEQTENGYGTDTLAKDILAVTKALKLDKPILIGHSIAGDEISKFASSYPDNVDKVIYMDAAYDRIPMNVELDPYFPPFPNPTTKDSSSLQHINAFIKRTVGVLMPDEEVENTSVFTEDGKYLKDITPDEIQNKIRAGIERPNYSGIDCPALAIYAKFDSVYTLLPYYDTLDTPTQKKADTLFTKFRRLKKEQAELFQRKVKNGVVKEIQGANHYIFISHPEETEKLIREFLK